MKKKIAIVLSAIMAIAMLGGCAAEESDTLTEIEVEKYVTLGEYKGLEVSVQDVAVDEEELEELAWDVYFSNITAEAGGIVDRPVEALDEVNIDYVGTLDGVAFDGGTAEGASLLIGSNSYIEGFETGLLGVMPGETVDLNLTFPDPYTNNPDLAGKEVVFTVTVNFIYPYKWDDALIASWGYPEFTNEEELRQYVYDYLYEAAQYELNSSIENAVLSAFMTSCTFSEVPENLITKYTATLTTSVESQAASYGMDADTFCYYFYGTDYATFLDTYAIEYAKQVLAFQAVANAEGLNRTEEEVDAGISELATASGYASVEEFMGDKDKEEYVEYFMIDDTIKFLSDNANITKVPVETTTAE